MRLWTIVSRNLLNRRMRSVLTVLGIAVGMMAVVGLLGLSKGFESSWDQTLNARGTDVVVNRVTTGNPVPAPFSEEIAREIAELPDVEATGGVLSALVRVDPLPMILATSWEWESYIWEHLEIVDGRMPNGPHEPVAMLGETAAEMLKRKVGDTIELEGDEFEVVGIFESASMLEASAIVLPLAVMQARSDNAGKLNFLNLRLEPDVNKERAREICREIEAKHAGLSASLASEAADHHSTTRAVKGMTLAVSLFALVVGLASVMNTMLMSVFERTVEIGVLRAIGWKKSRIRRMIVLEASLLGIMGGVVGVAFAFVARWILYFFPLIRGNIRIEIDLQAALSTVLFALVVGGLSGLYPAIRASRMKPSAAFQHQ